MQTANSIQMQTIIELRRDDCPVIFSNPGNVSEFAKRMQAIKKMMVGVPLQKDPAIELRKTRRMRGMA